MFFPPALVPSPPENLPSAATENYPDILLRQGAAAVFPADEFFYGEIRNPHTRVAYLRAVKRFLGVCQRRGMKLTQITPADVGLHLDSLAHLSIPSRKQHLAALRHFFDTLVTRHVVILNPALSVRGERYEAVEGKTPEISITDARKLLAGIPLVRKMKQRDGSVKEVPCLVGLRDHALLSILVYTAARAGAVACLRRGSFYDAGDQWMLRFKEKGGKAREIPVRHDLQGIIASYIEAVGLQHAPKDAPLFPVALGRTGKLGTKAIHVNDVCRMMKRRLKKAGLAHSLSPHSFRVTTITDLLEQSVPLEDVQRLAGHADPRTTRLYDRRQKRIARNIVERISI